MDHCKFYSAEVQRFGEPAVIVTAAYRNAGGYAKAEYFVLVPDQTNTVFANRITFGVKSFEDSPVELTDDLMHAAALDQAKIDLSQYLQDRTKQGHAVPQGTLGVTETTYQALVGPQFRGRFPQIADVMQKTEVRELEHLLSWIQKLPKLDKKAL